VRNAENTMHDIAQTVRILPAMVTGGSSNVRRRRSMTVMI
jgi:hypothetical protein